MVWRWYSWAQATPTDLVGELWLSEEGAKGEPGPKPSSPILWLQVILGGGRKYMFPKGTPDPEYPTDAKQNGIRLDGRNLVQEWQAKYQVMGACGRQGYNRDKARRALD